MKPTSSRALGGTNSTKTRPGAVFAPAPSSTLNTTQSGNVIQSRIDTGGRTRPPVHLNGVGKQTPPVTNTQIQTRQMASKNGTNQNGIKITTQVKNNATRIGSRGTISAIDKQKLDDLIENDLEGLLQQTLVEIANKEPPAGAPIFLSDTFLHEYNQLPSKVGPDASGSIRIQREKEIALYNNQHSLAKKVCTQYQNANKAIIQMKSDIQQFIYNQRTLEEQLLQHQKTYQEFAGRLKVLVEETKKSELQLVKLRGNCDQLQTSVLKTEDDHYQQSQRYEVESQRLEQLYVMLDQQERLNQTKKTQIISLHNELKTLELRLDDINTQLSDLRQLDEIQNMEKKEKELFESKQDITFQLSKSKEQLDTINASIHTRELHQQSLLKTIGPETQGMALELQNSVDMLLSEIGAIQRALEQTNTKITQYEVLIPQRREELELLKFELEQDSNFYDGLVQNLNEKKDGQKMDENNIEKLENEITQIQSKKHNDELQLSTDQEKWLLDNKLERESIENDVSTMRSRHNAKLQLLIQNCEKEIADFENQRDKLITLHESKSTSYSLLQDEFKLTSQQITSLQIQVDRFVELHAMSGPQLQHRITELISQQAKRSARIRQLKEQNSTYDDENLLLRRQKLQKVRDSNSEMENQIVQLGGSNLLSSLTRPQITPTYDQLSVHDLPQDDSYTDYIDDAPSHLCDTIYGIEDDIDGEETSARCDGGDDDDDDDDNNNNTNNNNNQNNHNLDPKRLKNQNSRTKIDISETQSLSLPTVIRPSNKTNTLPRNNGISGQPTSSTRITSRMSALPVTSAGTNTRQVTNTSTRPLGKVTATNIVTSKTSTVGVGNTKRIGTAKQDDSLPGYMRSTTASRGGR